MVFQGWGQNILVGVISHGKQRCQTAAVAMKVDRVLDWIEEKTSIRSRIDEFYTEYVRDFSENSARLCTIHTCPQTHPHSYYGGGQCCASHQEKINTTLPRGNM